MPKKLKKKMARERKPFWYDRLGCWYCWVYQNGKRALVRLAKDETEADRMWHEIRAKERSVDRPNPKDTHTVQGSIAAFIFWLQKQGKAEDAETKSGKPKKQAKTSPATIKWYRTFLVGSATDPNGKPKENNSFGMFVGPRLKMSELKLEHVENWLTEKLGDATENGRNGAVRAIRRFIRWAMTRTPKLLNDNPLVGLETPQYEPRDVRITDDEWNALLGAIPAGDEFAEFVKCLRATGMRPFELRIVEARHFQGKQLLFDIRESKGKKYRRSVPLNDAATEILTRMAEKRPEGTLFLNSRGRPRTQQAAVARVQKYREEAGLGSHITLYAIRHEFISAAIETEEVDPVTLAKIVGHRDLTMISRIYSHLSAKGKHLQRAVRKATGEKVD